ncbi:apolipoprotein N-acyltransferase [Paenochrobactrum sp. BZR 588]|uniref:apolipoprotein N-acyltransferase n=1 Tax=unclassified Paenochrobactrum TaxID=2639760 RepID=UPI003851CAA1
MFAQLAQKITLSGKWPHRFLSLFAGLLLTLALPPYDFLPVGFIAFPTLVWLLDRPVKHAGKKMLRDALPAFATGWWFGFGYFVGGLWWIGAALLVDAEQFAWALPLAVVGLPAFLALFYGFAAYLARLFWSHGVGRIFALAFGFGVAEYLRSFILTGFPWNSIGYTAMPTPLLMQSAKIVGLTGMNALAVMVFAMPALLVGKRHRLGGMVFGLLLVVAHLGYGAWQLHQPVEVAATNPHIRIVQPSIAQDLKWDNAERRSIFERHLSLTAQAPQDGALRPDIIIWPETSVPYILTQTPDALARIADVLQDGQLLMVGAVREEETPQGLNYYNSITVINDQGFIISSFDKVHLVPFGEYLPLEGVLRALGLQEVVEMPGGFKAGKSRHSLKIGEKLAILPLICYEAIFGNELDYQGERAGAIVNVTNDAWYGNTPGPYQHFRQAQLRAVEQGMPLLRAANNGISAVTDSYGRIIASLNLNEVGVVDAVLPPLRLDVDDKGWVSRQTWAMILLLLCGLLAIVYKRKSQRD